EDEAGDEVGGYVLGRELSRGHFSTVREAYHIEETKVKVGPVVVKIVRRGDDTSASTAETAETAEEAMRQELQIWRRLQHPNVLPLLDSFESPMALYAVSPRCPNGSLYHALRRFRRQESGDCASSFDAFASYGQSDGPRGLPLDAVRQIVSQLASAIRYLHHDAAVAHGDLKLENVLINAAGHVQIIDFGLSRELFDDNSNSTPARQAGGASAAGSLPYCAPELLRGGQPVSPASDCWALGVMIYALLMGELPFQDAYEPRLIFKIIHAQYELPEEV
ncbi:kinase-like domain-containing protein, partial [Syncephalis pseudoplumigaleata]